MASRDPLTNNPADAPADDAARTSAIAAGAIGAAFALSAGAAYDGRTALSVAIGAAIAVANLLTLRAVVKALVRAGDESAELPAGAAHDASPSNAQPPDAPEDPVDHRSEGRRGGAAWGVFAVLKIVLLFGGIWLLLTRKLVAPLPLVVGYGTLPIGIAASTLFGSLRPRSRRRPAPRRR